MQAVLKDKQPTENLAEAGGWRWAGVAVLIAAAILFFARLGARALWASEGRWGEIVREMHLTGHYFWPTIDGRLYYDKPLLSYWFILGAGWFTGALNEATTRIPSAIAGLLGVGLTIALGRRLYDRATGVIAGLILVTSYSFVFFSRTAAADMETLTGVLAALVLFEAHRERRQNGWWIVGLWAIMAVTSLTKGLIGFALTLFVLGCYSLLEEGAATLWQRIAHGPIGERVRWLVGRLRWFFNYKTPFAIAVAIAIYIWPFEISQAHHHSDAGLYEVFRENVVRFFAPFDHRGPVYLYLIVIFALMAPWSVFLPSALLERHRKFTGNQDRTGARNDLFALVYFWGTFVFFTLSRSRRSYYLVPILPAAALIVARLLRERSEVLWAPARRTLYAAYILLVAAIAIGGIAYLLPVSMRPGRLRILPPSPDAAIFAALWLVSLAGIYYALRRLSPRRIAVSVGIAAYAAMLFLFVFAMPAAERYRFDRPFARAVHARLAGNPNHLVLYNTLEPALIYYLDMPRPIAEFNTPSGVAAFARIRGPIWVIARERDAAALGDKATTVMSEPALPWASANHTRNRYLLLKLP